MRKSRVRLGPHLIAQMQYYTPSSPAAYFKIAGTILVVLAIIFVTRGLNRINQPAISLPQNEAILGSQSTDTSGVEFTEYEVGANETLASISEKFQVPWDAIVRLNSLSAPYLLATGQKLKLPLTKQVQKQTFETNLKKKIYVVQKGDTFVGIAQKLEISVTDLLRANPSLESPDFIKPGQTLRLP
jgi:LysM repeat protein